MPRNFVRFCKA